MNKSKLREQIELNEKIIPILLSGFRYGDKYDEHFVADQIRELLAQNRKAILEEVRSKVKFTKSEIDLLLNLIADNEKEGSYYGNRRIYWANRYKIRQKLSLLEGNK